MPKEGSISSKVGEVQATPTTYTLLRRLKDIYDNITTALTGIVLAAGSAVIGKVRLVTATGGEITDDTQDDVKTHRGKAGLLNSGVKAADTQIKSGAGAVYWLTVSDTAALALELNDSVGGAGTDLWALDLPASGYAHFIFDPPIEFATGIYLDVSTATCKVTIGYI